MCVDKINVLTHFKAPIPEEIFFEMLSICLDQAVAVAVATVRSLSNSNGGSLCGKRFLSSYRVKVVES